MENGVHGENCRPSANQGQTLLHKVAFNTPCHMQESS
jgi:hypothetical protein